MNKKKILLIEDEKDLAYAISVQLTVNNYEVLTAYDGQTGLSMARNDAPDLIILDLMLPKLDGYKLCRMLKFDEKYKHIPIIILTVRGNQGDKELGFEVGADAYITKPFEPQEILDKIKELL